jgi:hypothetical protein
MTYIYFIHQFVNFKGVDYSSIVAKFYGKFLNFELTKSFLGQIFNRKLNYEVPCLFEVHKKAWKDWIVN